MKKLFQGLHRVVLSPDNTSITAMCSVAGEVVNLQSPVAVTDDVEVWLTNLAVEMADTLAKLLVECVKSGESDLRKYPSQVGAALDIRACIVFICYNAAWQHGPLCMQ